MNHSIARPCVEPPEAAVRRQTSLDEAAPPAAAHPVLSRLLEEVRNDRDVEASYDRVHNRHNRGR